MGLILNVFLEIVGILIVSLRSRTQQVCALLAPRAVITFYSHLQTRLKKLSPVSLHMSSPVSLVHCSTLK